MEIDTRDLYISLIFAGNSPEMAFLNNPRHNLEEYIDALENEEYRAFKAKVDKEFLNNLDSSLMGTLYMLRVNLQGMATTDKNYPQILRAYNDQIKLTSPIIERLHRITAEVNTFMDLEIEI